MIIRTLRGLLDAGGGSIKTGPFGTSLSASEYSVEGVPIISVGEVGYGELALRPDTPMAPPEVIERLPEYLLLEGDIVFARKGAVDRSARVKASQSGWFLGSDGLRIRPGTAVDSRWLAFYLSSAKTREWVLRHAGGTTMLSLSGSTLGGVPVACPPLRAQIATAAVLGALDEKIAFNASVARTAREFALLQFDTIPASGRAPKKVGQILDLKYGKALPMSSRTAGSAIVVGSGGPAGTHDKALVDGPCVVVGRKGSVGSTYWIPGPTFPIDTTFFVQPNEDVSLIYCYSLLQSLDLAGMNSDSAVPGLNRNEALALPVMVPHTTAMREVSERAMSLFGLATQHDKESRTLAELRDTILPALMSGRLRVKDAERQVEDAV